MLFLLKYLSCKLDSHANWKPRSMYDLSKRINAYRKNDYMNKIENYGEYSLILQTLLVIFNDDYKGVQIPLK